MSDSPKPSPRRPDVTETELHGGIEKRTIVIVEPDATWAAQYAIHRERVATALGPVARAIEHIGSTSVPGLAAKPLIDMLLTVDDITAEEDYLDPLLDAGYRLRVREPGHRLVRTPERDVHLHILEVGDEAAEDYLLLRDQLRRSSTDRVLYEETKRKLAAQDWPDMNAYADAKSEVITEIKARALARRSVR